MTEPTTQLRKLNDRINAMIVEGEEEKKDWSDIWRDAQNYIFANQLAGRDAKKGWERIQVNYVWPAVQQQIAMMAQRRPKIVTLPWEANDTDGAAFWEPVLQWQFEHDLDLPFKAAAATLDANIYGFYVARVSGDEKGYWDRTTGEWQWRPRVSLVCPEFFGADPECENIDDAAYVYTTCRRRTAWVLERWPQFRKEIIEAAEKVGAGQSPIAFLQKQLLGTYSDDQDPGPKGDKKKGVEGRLVSLLRRAREEGTATPTEGDTKGIPRYVTLTEVFFRDGTEVDQQRPATPIPRDKLLTEGRITTDRGVYLAADDKLIEGVSAGQPIPDGAWPTEPGAVGKQPKFPYGRRVLRVGETILNNREQDQVWPFTRWPFVVGVNAILPHMWRGVNGVEPAKGLQDWLNVSASHLCNYVKYFGDPVVVAEMGAVHGVAENESPSGKLRSAAGAIWVMAKGGLNKIRRDPPPPLPPVLLAMYERFARELQDQLGSPEVSRGRQAKGQPTATEISELSRASRIRTSLSAQMQDVWIQRIMGLVAEFDQRCMTPGQLVRIAGDEHQGSAMRMPDGANDVRFDVKLRVGTDLPFDQEIRKREYNELFGLIGPAILPELLDAYNVPNKAQVMKRFDAWVKIQEMEEAEAGATQGGQG